MYNSHLPTHPMTCPSATPRSTRPSPARSRAPAQIPMTPVGHLRRRLPSCRNCKIHKPAVLRPTTARDNPAQFQFRHLETSPEFKRHPEPHRIRHPHRMRSASASQTAPHHQPHPHAVSLHRIRIQTCTASPPKTRTASLMDGNFRARKRPRLPAGPLSTWLRSWPRAAPSSFP